MDFDWCDVDARFADLQVDWSEYDHASLPGSSTPVKVCRLCQKAEVSPDRGYPIDIVLP